MPANLVKSPEDEKLWDKAKAAAAKKGGELNMAVVGHIFQRMKVAKKKVATPKAPGGI